MERRPSPPPASSRPAARAEPTGAPSLTVIALEKLAVSIQSVPSLEGRSGVLPEELTCTLFARVLELGKLNLSVLEVFERTEHEELLQIVQQMGIKRWTPPLLKTTRDGPLGFSKPPWQ